MLLEKQQLKKTKQNIQIVMYNNTMKQISIEQLQKLADYLVRQPYADVADLIQMIGSLEDIKNEKNKETKK